MAPPDAVVIPGDIRTDAAGIVEQAVEALGALHVVVNNAGTIRRNLRLHEVDLERIEEQLDTNLGAHVRLLHAALPHLLKAEGDRAIVNVGSTLAHKLVPGIAPYAAAKGGMVSLTRALAVEYGPDGIRVNAVMPAVVETPLAHTDRPDFDERKADMARAYPLKRLGAPEDVAEAIALVGLAAGGLGHGYDRRHRRRLQRHMIRVTVEADGRAVIDLAGGGEIRESIALDELDGPPALGSLVLHFDFYGRLARIEVTDSADSVLPPALLEDA